MEQHQPQKLGFWLRAAEALHIGAPGRLGKVRRLLRDAEKADTATALALCRQAVELGRGTQGMEVERDRLVGRALLRQGELHEQLGQETEALAAYAAALRTLGSLPGPALSYLASGLAMRGDRSAEALDTYLLALGQFKSAEKPARFGAVITLLESACAIAEDERSSDVRRVAMDFCKRVLKADSDFEAARYYLGLGQLQEGALDLALPNLEAAQRLGSRRPERAFWLAVGRGRRAFDQGLFEEAAEYLRTAKGLRPERSDILLLLGRSLIQHLRVRAPQGNGQEPSPLVSEAIEVLEATARLAPAEPEVAYYQGQAHELAGNDAAAVECFERAVQLAPGRVQYHLYLALGRRRIGEDDGALTAARAALALNERCVPAYRLVGKIALERQELSVARQAWLQVCAADPDDDEANGALGFCAFQEGRLDRAIAQFERVIVPSDAHLFCLARCHSLSGQFRSAAQRLEELLTRRPKHVEACYRLGLAYAHTCRLAEAAARLEQAISLGTPRAEMHLQYGHVLTRLDRIQAARDAYLAAQALAPEDADVLLHLAHAHQRLGDNDAALPLLQRVLEARPDDLALRRSLAVHHERAGELALALKELARVVEGAPDDAWARRRAGVLSCRLGDTVGGLAHLQRAAALGDDSSELLYYTGAVAANQEQFTAALTAWQRLAERHPEDRRLTLNLERLRYLYGAWLIRQEQWTEAAVQWVAYLRTRPESDVDLKKDVAVLQFRTALRVAAESPDAARERLTLAASLVPGTAAIEYGLGLCDLINRQWREAATQIQAAIPRLPARAQAAASFHLGLSHYGAGDAAAAEQVLRQAWDAAREDGGADWHLAAGTILAAVLTQRGAYSDALQILRA